MLERMPKKHQKPLEIPSSNLSHAWKISHIPMIFPAKPPWYPPFDNHLMGFSSQVYMFSHVFNIRNMEWAIDDQKFSPVGRFVQSSPCFRLCLHRSESLRHVSSQSDRYGSENRVLTKFGGISFGHDTYFDFYTVHNQELIVMSYVPEFCSWTWISHGISVWTCPYGV